MTDIVFNWELLDINASKWKSSIRKETTRLLTCRPGASINQTRRGLARLNTERLATGNTGK